MDQRQLIETFQMLQIERESVDTGRIDFEEFKARVGRSSRSRLRNSALRFVSAAAQERRRVPGAHDGRLTLFVGRFRPAEVRSVGIEGQLLDKSSNQKSKGQIPIESHR